MFGNFRNTIVRLFVGGLILGVLAGPAMAYLGWTEGQRLARVMTEGVETKAVPESGTRRTGRRSGTSYSLNLSWQAPDGTRQRAEGVSISSALANQVITGDQITRSSLNIRYLPSDPTRPVLVDDAANRGESSKTMVYLGIAWCVGGLAALALLLRQRSLRRRADVAQPA